jgi:hypothetical protein
MIKLTSTVFLALVLGACGSSLQVNIASDFSYDILVDGVSWLHSAPTFVRVDGKTYSSKDQSLRLVSTEQHQGSDYGGQYVRHVAQWSAAGKPWVTSVRIYNDHVAFGQVCNLVSCSNV